MTNLELADEIERRRNYWLSRFGGSIEQANASLLLEDCLKANLSQIIGALRGEVRLKMSELKRHDPNMIFDGCNGDNDEVR